MKPSTVHRRRVRRRSLIAALLVSATVAASCSFTDKDEPARVTIPQRTTSTTLPGSSTAPSTTIAPERREPLQMLWSVQIGGVGDDDFAAITGHQAGILAAGSTDKGVSATSVGSTDALVASIDSSGTVIGVQQAGASDADSATGVGAGGEVAVICGSTHSSWTSPSGGGSDAWCGSVSGEGSVSGVTQIGGSDSERLNGAAMAADGTTGYAAGSLEAIAGAGLSNDLGGGDALVVRFDPTGQTEWARQVGTTAADTASAVDVAENGDGIVVGSTDGDLEGPSHGGRDSWISRFDRTGTQRWVTQFGSEGNDTFNAVAATGDPRRGTEYFVAAGATDADVDGDRTTLNAGGVDAFISVFDTSGTPGWTTQIGASTNDTASGVAVDGRTVYVVGTTAAPDPADPDADQLGDLDEAIGPGGGADGFLAALDVESGEVLWVTRFGSPGDETMSGITITEDGLLVLSGTTTGQMASTPPGGGEDGFVLAFPLPSAGGGAASSV